MTIQPPAFCRCEICPTNRRKEAARNGKTLEEVWASPLRLRLRRDSPYPTNRKLSAAAPILAQTDLTKPADLSVPDSPAFTALGLTPQTVTRPAAPMTFATSLLTAVDDQGKLQNGLAIDFTPYLVFHGNKLTLTDYQKKAFEGRKRRLLSHFNVSIATTKRTDNDPTQRLAGGLHLTVFDFGDPRMDDRLLDCYDEAAKLLLPTPSVPDDLLSEEGRKRRDKVNAATLSFVKSDAVTKCADEASKRNRNRSSWVIAGAPIWVTATGEANDLTEDGGAIWTSLAYGYDRFRRLKKDEPEPTGWLRKNAQIIVHARWRANERVKGDDGVTVEHDRSVVGARFRAGGTRTIGSVELTYLDDSTVAKDSSKVRALLGLEQRLADGFWLQLSFGREFAEAADDEHLVIRSSFHWAFNAAPKQWPFSVRKRLSSGGFCSPDIAHPVEHPESA